MSASDKRILDELRGHLKTADQWANEADNGHPGYEGWTCIKSTMEAVEAGNVGLALTRWDDLSTQDRPMLASEKAEVKIFTVGDLKARPDHRSGGFEEKGS